MSISGKGLDVRFMDLMLCRQALPYLNQKLDSTRKERATKNLVNHLIALLPDERPVYGERALVESHIQVATSIFDSPRDVYLALEAAENEVFQKSASEAVSVREWFYQQQNPYHVLWSLRVGQ